MEKRGGENGRIRGERKLMERARDERETCKEKEEESGRKKKKQESKRERRRMKDRGEKRREGASTLMFS